MVFDRCFGFGFGFGESPIPNSQFPIPNPQFPIPNSQSRPKEKTRSFDRVFGVWQPRKDSNL
ncbi:hypothetical protein, partial [Stenotrophomonas sp.]|uniref:hypothetical protein n=1 Tax=Stenotrophomonas sp. TaxID=69392 RepID=UPI0028AAE807